MMQFIIHTGCLRTYGVAFVCQGAGCFMMVTAGICISGRLPASSLSSSRMKIDTALWKHMRGFPILENSEPRGWVSLAGFNLHPLGNRGDAEALEGVFPAGVQTPLPASPNWGWLCSGGCSGQRIPPLGRITPTEGGSSTPCLGTKGSLSERQPHPQGQEGQVKGTKPSLASPS